MSRAKTKKRKAASRDITLEDLPHNRVHLFAEIMRNEWKSVIILALIFLAVMIPFLINRYYYLVNVNEIASKENPDVNLIYTATFTYLAIESGLLLVVSFVEAGALRIIKRLCFGQGILFGADFLEGIKENWKEALGHFIIFALLSFLCEYGAVLLSANPLMHYLLRIVRFGLILPIFLVALSVSAIYSDGFFRKLGVSVAVFLKHLPSLALASIIVFAPLLLLLIPYTYAQIFVPIGYGLILLAPSRLVFALFLNSALDKEINERSMPALYRKGLRKDI